MVKLVIFDLDGTLVDAYTAIEKSLNFTLGKLEYPKVSYSKARRAVGMGDVNFIKRFVKDEDIKKALHIYRKHHKFSLVAHAKLISEAKLVLSSLKKRGCKLAIASNRPRRFTNILLSHLGLKRYFDVIACGRNNNDIKPKPNLLFKVMRKLKADKDETIYVGDMAIDVYAGRNAGIKTIAVLGGSSSRLELKKARPFKLISRLSGVLKLIC